MGRKRTRSRRRRRFKRKKRRKSRMNRLTVAKFPTSFPDTLLVKQLYSSQISWTAAASGTQIYAINNLNDLDATASGAQLPNLYDELSQMYNRYKVYAAKIDVICTNLSATEAVKFTLNPQNPSTAYTYRNTMENAYSKAWVCGIESGGHNIVRRSQYIALKKLAGESLVGHDYDGTLLVDPNIKFHWILQGDSMGGGNITMDVQVKLTYYVKWYHRLPVVASEPPPAPAAE